MAREDLHFRLRIPEALKARIAASAEANKRSMTAEIVHRLERSLEDALLTEKIAALDASLEPHERVVVMFQEALDAMMRVKSTIKREFGVEPHITEDDS